MFGTSGIRGPVGDEITTTLALRVGHALGVDCKRVVVGRDPRESGRMLADALTAGLCESGVEVVDLGMEATPTIARAVGEYNADAGVAITASHNPPPDNGFKLWQPSGQAFDESLRDRIESRILAEESSPVSWDKIGQRNTVEGAGGIQSDARESHLSAITHAVSISQPPSVIVDVGNGAGGITVDALEALGCSVQTLNAQPDGAFPGRPSEPTADNCQSLGTLVGETDADVGIAHDGDADRMRAVDERGTFLTGDVLLALFARASATAGDTVAVPVDTSLAVEDHLAAADIEVTRTKVGDVYVADAASQDGVTFGGEPSGAWIWPEETLCPDGPLAACKLVGLVAERPLSERAGAIETYPLRRENVEVSDKDAAMASIRNRVSERFDHVSTLDGVRVDLEDGWFLIRSSGTQPLIRLTVQAREQSRLEDLYEITSELLPATD